MTSHNSGMCDEIVHYVTGITENKYFSIQRSYFIFNSQINFVVDNFLFARIKYQTISLQPYRTTPLVLPGAKVKREPGPTESYLRHHPNPAVRAPPHALDNEQIYKQKVLRYCTAAAFRFPTFANYFFFFSLLLLLLLRHNFFQ